MYDYIFMVINAKQSVDLPWVELRGKWNAKRTLRIPLSVKTKSLLTYRNRIAHERQVGSHEWKHVPVLFSESTSSCWNTMKHTLQI